LRAVVRSLRSLWYGGCAACGGLMKRGRELCRSGGRGAAGAPDGLEVGVEARGELVEEGLEGLDLFVGEEVAAVGAAEEVLRLVERAARDADEPAVVLVAPASAPLGDVRADAVSCAHELLAYGFTGERRPRQHEIPHRVRQLLREPVHLQILKSRSCHQIG